ncbi:MAG TPA: COX15/CtaA family protein [Thermoanaerobaculia bacterium]|nr:COX15/CtaA family protein [Thermoanaerobaculia bacterium]
MSAESPKDRDAHAARNAGILRVATQVVAFGVFVLLVAGALVTSTESGLAVPDWPLSYGKVMPPMVGGILYEHGHRLIAAAVSTLVGLEMAMLFFLERRKGVKRLGMAAFAAILVQAVLGGLTVLLLLPPAVSSAHAALAEIVFALTAVVALMCSKTWNELTLVAAAYEQEENLSSNLPIVNKAFHATLLATAAIYVQIVLGAVMRHTGAGLAIPDFPAAFGGLWPSADELSRRGVGLHLAHRVGAAVVLALVLLAVRALARLSAVSPVFAGFAAGWAGLVAIQILLGALSIWSKKAPPLTAAHLAGGALCWVTGILAAVSIGACRNRENAVSSPVRT